MATQPLNQLAKTIRSKNAGVNKITFDIIFRDAASYERVIRSGAISRESMANLYAIPQGRISDFVEYEPGLAIKFTIYRNRPSGSAGDGDIFGAQQYAPLLECPPHFVAAQPVAGGLRPRVHRVGEPARSARDHHRRADRGPAVPER